MVISIISILSSIVMVSLQRGRTKAKNIKTVAEVKQIMTAFDMYYTDHNSYPASGSATLSSCFGSNNCYAQIPITTNFSTGNMAGYVPANIGNTDDFYWSSWTVPPHYKGVIYMCTDYSGGTCQNPTISFPIRENSCPIGEIGMSGPDMTICNIALTPNL